MSRSVQTDTEKKIAEIREALEKATHGQWKWVDVYKPEWLQFLTQAVEMYRELMHELDKENDHLHEKINELEKLKQERDKLIEGLRWYADKTNYVQEVHHFWHGTLIEPAEAIYYDGGQRARDILHEIGVMVDA